MWSYCQEYFPRDTFQFEELRTKLILVLTQEENSKIPPADTRVLSQALGHSSPLTEIPTASLSISDDKIIIPVTSAATAETSKDQEPRRDRKTPSGIFLADIKACTGCGKNAMGDTNAIKCQNAHCPTEWVRI